MSRTRPDTIDTHGVRHRHGCPMPGWTSDSPRIAGTHVLRCPACGAIRLTTPRGVDPVETGGAVTPHGRGAETGAVRRG